MKGWKGDTVKAALEGFIVNFRRGPKTQKADELIVEIPEVNSRAKASPLIGRKVLLKLGEEKTIVGKVVSTHGGKGRLRVRLRKGLPGQLLTTRVRIV
ncbi:MAG: 50S ribosomal protein L35ae [Candidatus Hecatellaceae archaeon]